MCGRACCSCPTYAIAATYGVSPDCMYGGDRFQPRYNLHPGHKSPVIVREANYKKHRPHQAKHEEGKEGKGGGEGGEPAKGCKKRKDEGGEEVENAKAVVVMHWGLIPSWHKEGEKLDFFRAFNARSETVDSKPMFRRLVGSKRCIVCMVCVNSSWSPSLPPNPSTPLSSPLPPPPTTDRKASTNGRR